MQKALTKEDLLYILNGIFKLSAQPQNAFRMLQDGLYVKDITEDLQSHIEDATAHVTADILDILNKFTVDNKGNIYYDTKLLSKVSQEENNAIQQKEDGIFVPDLSETINQHVLDNDVHVTVDNKNTWDNMLQESKTYAEELFKNISIYNFEFVAQLPTENISSTTCYIYTEDPEKIEGTIGTPFIYARDAWNRLNISSNVLQALQDTILDTVKESYALKDDLHNHNNKSTIDKFAEDDNGNLLYNNTNIRELDIYESSDNAAKIIDGKLFVQDYKETINSLVNTQGFVKFNLINQDCDKSGVYELKGFIDDFNLLLIEYYYKPNDGDVDLNPGNAKTMLLDVDSVNALYERGLDIMLDLGYGVSSSNSKIRIHDDKLWINYYHGCCVYRLTGIKGGGTIDE